MNDQKKEFAKRFASAVDLMMDCPDDMKIHPISTLMAGVFANDMMVMVQDNDADFMRVGGMYLASPSSMYALIAAAISLVVELMTRYTDEEIEALKTEANYIGLSAEDLAREVQKAITDDEITAFFKERKNNG